MSGQTNEPVSGRWDEIARRQPNMWAAGNSHNIAAVRLGVLWMAETCLNLNKGQMRDLERVLYGKPPVKKLSR